MIRVFVYGTLKRGQPNNYLLENAENGKAIFIGEGETVKKYPLVIASRCNLPFLLHVEGTGKNVKGDIYEVNEDMMKWLDDFEDYPILYDRHVITVLTNNTVLECRCYFLVNHKPELLSLPHMDSYDSNGAHNKQYQADVDDEYDEFDDVQTTIIKGDVFDVDELMLKCLDELECHPVFYRRQDIQVIVNNMQIKCYSYFLDNFKQELFSLPFEDTFDYFSLSEGRKYVRRSERSEDTRENFWTDVKLKEHYISPREFLEQRKKQNKN